MIFKTLHRKLKIEQWETHYDPEGGLMCPGRISSSQLLRGVLDTTLCYHILLFVSSLYEISGFLLLIFFLYDNSKITVHIIIIQIEVRTQLNKWKHKYMYYADKLSINKVKTPRDNLTIIKHGMKPYIIYIFVYVIFVNRQLFNGILSFCAFSTV